MKRSVTKRVTVNTRDNMIHEKSSFIVENHAAPLKGEFNRIDFMKADNIDTSNAIVVLETKLPLNIHNLFISDQVGNVTTSKAKYNDESIGIV